MPTTQKKTPGDTDIRTVARFMTQRLGDAALSEAGLRLGQALLANDKELAAIWRRVVRAIGRLRTADGHRYEKVSEPELSARVG